jgi:predicted ATPase
MVSGPDTSRDQQPLRLLQSRRADLPLPPTSLIGREGHLAIACAYLRGDVRLLTLTGPPGAGKTRMALAVAAALDSDFDDAVVFVRLETVRDPQLVLPAVAGALAPGTGAGPMSEADLAEYLRDKHILLVLDNFEQVLGAAQGVAQLLAACPTLKVLATSRAALRLRAEQELPIPPLALPKLGVASRAPAEARESPETVAAIAAAPAVQLFVQRVRALRPDFDLHPDNGAGIAAICARLDGLPLAIELAAARGKALSPSDIQKRLGRRLQILRSGAEDLPPRQRTLRAALDWSYELLNAAEQRLFRRFGVFAGGATLTTLGAVEDEAGGIGGADTAPEDARLDLVTSLVDWSLLTAEHGADTDETRYRMLETIREYALLQLESTGELATMRQQHAKYYSGIALQAEAALSGPGQSIWLERLKAEHENLRAALDWSLDSGNAALGLQLVCALERFWILGGYLFEGRRW